jgi:exoribonuclease-2
LPTWRATISASATLAQQAGALFRLYDAPHYFRRAGKGRFKKAPAEILQQALAAIEKKKQAGADRRLGRELGRASARSPSASSSTRSCSSPTRTRPNTRPWSRPAAPRTWRRWSCCRPAPSTRPTSSTGSASCSTTSPRARAFRRAAPQPPADLPLAAGAGLSIDDSQTTEIDDALSVQGLGTGTVTLGIHIAAPGLAIQPGGELDKLGRARLSTVYMPGYKITMLPDDVVQIYTLDEGRANPAVSLYVTSTRPRWRSGQRNPLERVPMAANLRHDQLDHIVTEAWLPTVDSAKTPQALLDRASSYPFCTAWRAN